MSDDILLKDIMLDDEPLGLAENLLPPDVPLSVHVITDEEAQVGAEVFFGVGLPIDAIGEVTGEVISCEKKDEADFIIGVRVLGLDNRYKALLTNILQGTGTSDISEEYPIWGTGIRQTNGTFATVINCSAGLLNTEQLTKINDIASRGTGLIKLTHAQRVILLLTPEQQGNIKEELKSVGLEIGVLHHGIRNIRGCCGSLCEWDQGNDAMNLSIELNKVLFGRPTKHDIKIAVSGCARNCMESFCVDIGLIAKNGTYSVFVGGVSSSVHFKGLKLRAGVPPDDVIPFVEQILEWYENNARKGERLYKTLERLGYQDARGKEDVFAYADHFFKDMDIGDDIASRLDRTLSRSYGLMKMRKDMGV